MRSSDDLLREYFEILTQRDELRCRRDTLFCALAEPESPAGAMRVTEFLTSIPAIGEGKRVRILKDLEISPVKRLGGLGSKSRPGSLGGSATSVAPSSA